MEIQIRIVFLVLGLLILFGVAVDVYRRRNLTKSNKSGSSRYKPRSDLLHTIQENPAEYDDLVHDYVDESVGTPYVREYVLDNLDDVAEEAETLIDIANPQSDIEMLDDDIYEDQYSNKAEPEEPPATIQDVIAIFIMSRSPYGFSGDELYTAIGNAHLHLGKNNLFYRYAQDNGSGEALFSLVKAVEPGYFNVDILRQEHVPGVTLLMLPSKVSDPLLALDKLIRAAKQISFVLNGELLDHTRHPLTLDTIEKYKQQIQTINA